MKSKKTIHRIIFSIFLLVFLSLNHYPIEWILVSWYENSHYQHGYFIIVLLLLILRKIPNQFNESYVPKRYIPLMIFCLAMSTLAEFHWRSPLLGIISIWIFLISIFHSFFSQNKRLSYYLFALMLVLTPMPGIYALTSSLQTGISSLASSILSFIGYAASLIDGKVVMEKGTFIVGAASSGIRSFLVLPSLSLSLLVWKPAPLARGITYFIVVVLMAVLFNLLRVCAMLITSVYSDPQIAYGLFHDTGNTIVFIMAIVCTYFLFLKICKE